MDFHNSMLSPRDVLAHLPSKDFVKSVLNDYSVIMLNLNTHRLKVMIVIGTFDVVVRRNSKYFHPLAHVNVNFFCKRRSLLQDVHCETITLETYLCTNV